MKQQEFIPTKPQDFEGLGFDTMLETRDLERTKEICALRIHAFADAMQAEIGTLRSELQQTKYKSLALHIQLYDPADPVIDAVMLARGSRIRLFVVLALLAAIASVVGNVTTFCLFGFGLTTVLVLAVGTTTLPLVIGHLAYEHITAHHKRLQAILIVLAIVLCCGALFRLAEARRMMLAKTAPTSSSASYVDDASAATESGPTVPQSDISEAKIRETLGGGMFLLALAADLVLGLLLGAISEMRSDKDYVAWQELEQLALLADRLQERITKLLTEVEIAKKCCMAGILRAQAICNKRAVPYHQILTALMLVTFFGLHSAEAQTIEHYEGILIDSSRSIQRGRGQNDLFREYLVATRKLLLTEPPNTRVVVYVIARDSFGDGREITRGWTPDARGAFTDDLNRARRQLAASFEAKSSGMSPSAAGTDILGGLWKLKALFEASSPQSASKSIWIFSDMMNETNEFPMPELLELGPERMLERAKRNGQVIPLKGYKVYVFGATTSGVTPHDWGAIREFWTTYFHAAGAEVISYSPEFEVGR